MLTVVSTTILLFSTGVPSTTGVQVGRGRGAGGGGEGGGVVSHRACVRCAPLAIHMYRSALPPRTQFTFIDVATLFGIICGYLSTFLAWSYTRAGAKLGRLQARCKRGWWLKTAGAANAPPSASVAKRADPCRYTLQLQLILPWPCRRCG